MATTITPPWEPPLAGVGPGESWQTINWDENPDWDYTTAADDTPEELYAIWDGAVARSRVRVDEALAKGGLDLEASVADGGVHASLRRLICDLIEEYGRHTGHADLLRESVDGLVGEDPPGGQEPVEATAWPPWSRQITGEHTGPRNTIVRLAYGPIG